MNFVEKIVQRFVPSEFASGLRAGEIVPLRPRHVMTHDNTIAVLGKFLGLGLSSISDPRIPVFTLDHDIQNSSSSNLAKYARIESFAKEHKVDFYPAGRGIGHQIMLEEGYAFPGTMVVASDSHSNMYGGIGCLGTPVVRTDVVSLWSTGETWWQIPQVARVELQGKSLPSGVTGKDVIIALCGIFNNDEVLNLAVEFVGEGVQCLTIDDRLTISNMTTEWGAVAGIFPIDDNLMKWMWNREEYLRERGPSGVPSDSMVDSRDNYQNPRINKHVLEALQKNPLHADENAKYARGLSLNLENLSPSVAGPNSVKTIHLARDLQAKDIKVNKAYLVSCVNSREQDISAAARIMKGRKIHEDVKFYVAAASSEVERNARNNGDWEILLSAGAVPLPAGCGPCIGMGEGLLEDGEVGISATNRNFKGRMGSRSAFAYLSSPEVVAASAIAGKIVDPANVDSNVTPLEMHQTSFEIFEDLTTPADAQLIPGFPSTISGNFVFCNADNINTDGIYAGKYTYRQDMTNEEMAKVAMENYDPNFHDVYTAGDIIVAGFNFGTGSSREQAATSLKFKGVPLIIVGSVSVTYQRNALNNGFLIIQCPDLVNFLRTHNLKYFKTPSIKISGDSLLVDFKSNTLHLIDSESGKSKRTSFHFSPLGKIAQELYIMGGLETWLSRKLED